MSIQAVAKGSGYYRVHVKDAGGTWQKYTRHTQVHKAIQVASELIEGGEPIVLVDHDFNLEITDSNAQHTPNLPSDDDLASDITSIVAAGRSLDGTTTKLYVRGMGIEDRIRYATDYAVERSRTRTLGSWITTELRTEDGKKKLKRIGFAWRGAVVVWRRATFRIVLEDLP